MHGGVGFVHGSFIVLQATSVWSERKQEDWFCTHIGWRPLEQLQPLHLYFTFLFQPVHPPSYAGGSCANRQ